MELRGRKDAGGPLQQGMHAVSCSGWRAHRFSLIWCVGLILGLGLGSLVRLPFTDPLGVVGKLTLLHYNPANNVLKYLFAVLMPSALLLCLTKGFGVRVAVPAGLCRHLASVRSGVSVPWGRKVALLAAGGVLVLALGLNLPTYHSWGGLDTFHEGEALGTSVSVEAGQVPYRDFVFVHGLIQDPYRAIIAYKLFKQSIGAVRTYESMMKVVAYFALFVLLACMLDWNALGVCSAFVLLVLMVRLKMLLVMPRDVPVFIFMASLVYILRHCRSATAQWLLTGNVVLAAAMAALAFVYSIDRGFYLMATLLVLLPYAAIAAGSAKLALLRVLAACLGLSFGGALLYRLTQGHLLAFADYVFGRIPKYNELMCGAPFRLWQRGNLLALAAVGWPMYVVLCDCLTALRGDGKPLRQLLECVHAHAELLAFLLLAFFFMRSALGRADHEHLIYSAAPLCLAYVHLFRAVLIAPQARLQRFGERRMYAVLGVLMVGGVISVGVSGLLRENFPLQVADEYFIPQDDQRTIRFVRTHTHADEGFVTLTSEASWYYFVDKPSPSRFPVIWFAATRGYQAEALRNILRGNVRFVLYTNRSWSTTIDEISMRERMPILFAGIERAFVPCVSLDGNELWVRRDLYTAQECAR